MKPAIPLAEMSHCHVITFLSFQIKLVESARETFPIGSRNNSFWSSETGLAAGNGDVYGSFYEKQDPESDLVTLNCQPIKIGPSMACFLRGDEE